MLNSSDAASRRPKGKTRRRTSALEIRPPHPTQRHTPRNSAKGPCGHRNAAIRQDLLPQATPRGTSNFRPTGTLDLPEFRRRSSRRHRHVATRCSTRRVLSSPSGDSTHGPCGLVSRRNPDGSGMGSIRSPNHRRRIHRHRRFRLVRPHAFARDPQFAPRTCHSDRHHTLQLPRSPPPPRRRAVHANGSTYGDGEEWDREAPTGIPARRRIPRSTGEHEEGTGSRDESLTTAGIRRYGHFQGCRRTTCGVPSRSTPMDHPPCASESVRCFQRQQTTRRSPLPRAQRGQGHRTRDPRSSCRRVSHHDGSRGDRIGTSSKHEPPKGVPDRSGAHRRVRCERAIEHRTCSRNRRIQRAVSPRCGRHLRQDERRIRGRFLGPLSRRKTGTDPSLRGSVRCRDVATRSKSTRRRLRRTRGIRENHHRARHTRFTISESLRDTSPSCGSLAADTRSVTSPCDAGAHESASGRWGTRTLNLPRVKRTL